MAYIISDVLCRLIKATPTILCMPVSYFLPFQIMLYIALTFVSSVVYMSVYVVQHTHPLGVILEDGLIAIFAVGGLTVLVWCYLSYRSRLRRLHARSQLKLVIERLTNLYEETSKQGSMASWYKKIGTQKVKKFVENPWSTTNDLAFLLIEFERHIIFTRLDRKFLQARNQWIAALLACNTGSEHDFDKFIPLIDTLRDAITSPTFYSLCLKALTEESDLFRSAPIDICLLIMEFVVASSEVSFFAKNAISNPQYLPKYEVLTERGVFGRMRQFGSSCDSQLGSFVSEMKEIERNRALEQQQKEAQQLEHQQQEIQEQQPKQQRSNSVPDIWM